MSPQGDATSAASDARAQRRWMIGLGITVAFGIFGAVMAVLAYSKTTSSPTAAPQPAGRSAPAPEKEATPQPREEESGRDKGGRDKGHGRK